MAAPTNTQETLAMFCSKSDTRAWMLTPFRLNGFLYASNGHWLVRMPDDAAVEAAPYSDAHPRKLEEMFAAAADSGYQPLPELKQPALCEVCEGRGMGKSTKCDSCDGDGEFEHHGHTYDCKACDSDDYDFYPHTKGSDPCPNCHGYGMPYSSIGVVAGAAKFSPVYLWLLRSLPGIQIATIGADKAGHFTFDGGDGLVMPFRE